MAEHPNVTIIRSAYEAFAKDDLDGALADRADDCVSPYHETFTQVCPPLTVL